MLGLFYLIKNVHTKGEYHEQTESKQIFQNGFEKP